ncbi:hypothetical protein [Streptomyces sp. MMS20-AI2-20]|uniref:hypothetical protein n=1 Tax=Streptomyces sp. MMS20-AI2-20 TaxID=2925835 RepID=UPI001F624788|nr:hypothetical protein [Streptomyces sp. MMS20-AI2-20]MCI4145765.1 hypothetical protein [Streptomyces sp. MMS20-AI2-20]
MAAEEQMIRNLQAAATFHQQQRPEAVARLANAVTVPVSLKAWWMLTHGTGTELEWDDPPEALFRRSWLPGWQTFVSVQAAVSLHGRITDGLLDYENYAGQWIPFAMFDPDGITGFFVDANASAATAGHVAEWNLEDAFTSEGTLLPEWLEEIAAALQGGRGLELGDGLPPSHRWPCLREGALRWLDLAGDKAELKSEYWEPVNDPR